MIKLYCHELMAWVTIVVADIRRIILLSNVKGANAQVQMANPQGDVYHVESADKVEACIQEVMNTQQFTIVEVAI